MRGLDAAATGISSRTHPHLVKPTSMDMIMGSGPLCGSYFFFRPTPLGDLRNLAALGIPPSPSTPPTPSTPSPSPSAAAALGDLLGFFSLTADACMHADAQT